MAAMDPTQGLRATTLTANASLVDRGSDHHEGYYLTPEGLY